MTTQTKTPISLNKLRQYSISIFRFLVSVFLTAWAIQGVDWQKFTNTLSQINFGLILIVPFLYTINVLFSVFRWKIILNHWNIAPSFFYLLRIYLTATFMGNFLPTTIGGDGYRYIALQSLPNASRTKIFSSILLDRLYGFAALGISHFLITAIYLQELKQSRLLLTLELFIALGFLVGVVLSASVGIYIKKISPNNNADTLASKYIAKFSDIFILLTRQKIKTNIWGLLFSFVCVTTVVFSWQTFNLMTNTQIGIGIAFYIATTIGLLGLLPITINGIGVMEFCQTAILNWQGLPSENAILAVFLVRVVSLVFTLPGGILYLLNGARGEIHKAEEL